MHPRIVRSIVSPTLESLLGRNTFSVFRRLIDSDWADHGSLKDLQVRKLRGIVRSLLANSQAYASLTTLEHGWQPADLEDLVSLPLVDKALMTAHLDGWVNHSVPGGAIKYRTGGSSGAPFIFYLDKRRQAWDKAARMRTHAWWGHQPGDREAYIWNSPVELGKQDRVKAFRDWLTNEKLFSASDLGPDTIGDFVAALRRFRPHSLFGYPSAMTLMCELANEAGLRIDDLGVKVVFSTAEVLYPHQREVIGKALGGVPVANGYGSREGGFIAHECPEGRMHVTDENVIVEIVRDGEPVPVGDEGEIVVTQLDNYAMPFIRYRTGDIGHLTGEQCPCGRAHTVMGVVQGRTNDFLIAPDGHSVHASAVSAIMLATPGVETFQAIQGADHHVRLLMVTDAAYEPASEQAVREALLQRLGEGGSVSVEYHDHIPPGPSGKFRYVISELSALTNDPRMRPR